MLEWVSTLPHADRRTLWSRYERASSGGRAADAPADDFARSLANYVAEVRIRKDLKAIVDMRVYIQVNCHYSTIVCTQEGFLYFIESVKTAHYCYYPFACLRCCFSSWHLT